MVGDVLEAKIEELLEPNASPEGLDRLVGVPATDSIDDGVSSAEIAQQELIFGVELIFILASSLEREIE